LEEDENRIRLEEVRSRKAPFAYLLSVMKQE